MTVLNRDGAEDKAATETAKTGLEEAEAGLAEGEAKLDQSKRRSPASAEAAEQEVSDGSAGRGLNR